MKIACDFPGCRNEASGACYPDRGRQQAIFYCDQCTPRLHEAPFGVRHHYLRCLLEGTTHSLALMFALGQPPMSNTDREFLEGACNGNQFEGQPLVGDYYKSVAAAAGQDTTGKVYKHGLARFAGDPEAWVSGRGDVQRLIEQRGWTCQGAVNVDARANVPAYVPPEQYRVADDLVEREVQQIVAGAEDARAVDVQELREQVREARSPDWGP